MNSILIVAVAILTLGTVVLLSAQVELHRQMAQLRDIAGLIDRPLPIDLGDAKGIRSKDIGLTLTDGLLLFLSDRCSTCRSLAESLDGQVPPELQIIFENPGGRKSTLPSDWDLGPRAMNDTSGHIAKRLGIEISPAAVVIQEGLLIDARTVPSSRQLNELLKSAGLSQVRKVSGRIAYGQINSPMTKE